MSEISLKLDPVDMEFLERVTNRVTESNALPFEIPVARMPALINRAMRKAYELSIDATENSWLIIPNSEIRKARTNFNAPLKLPESVVAIMQAYTTNSAITSGINTNDFYRNILFNNISNSYQINGYNGGIGQANNQWSYGSTHPSVSDGIISLFEYSVYQSALKKGIRFSFNSNSKTLNVQGADQGSSIVLDCFVKLDKADLFKDIFFEDYVVALTNESLAKILGTFTFALPGKVTINYQEIKEHGKEERERIEEYWKSQQTNDFIFSS